MDYGIAQGLERVSGNVLNVGMGMMRLQADQRHQQVVEANSAKQLEMEQARLKIQTDEAAKKQVAYDAPLDITTTPEYLGMAPESQKRTLETFQANKITDERGVGKTGDIVGYRDTLAATSQTFKHLMEPTVEGKRVQVAEAWKKVDEAKLTGDPKKVQQAMTVFNMLNGEYAASRGAYEKHIKDLQDNEQALELKKQEETAKATAARIKANAPAKEKVSSPENERLLLKAKREAETYILANPDAVETSAYVDQYNEISKTDEYVQETKVNKWMPDEIKWVKRKIGGKTKTGATRSWGETKKDKFGYIKDEIREGHKYIGNDKWEKL